MAKGKYRNKRLAAQGSAKADAAESAETWALAEEQMSHAEGAAALVDLDFADQAARNAAGKEEKTYGIWGPIWKFLKWYDAKKGIHTFKKKNYLLFMLFLGWMGGHRYYQGRRILGLVYTAFCWTGIPLILCVTDFMEIIPRKADENGMVTL